MDRRACSDRVRCDSNPDGSAGRRPAVLRDDATVEGLSSKELGRLGESLACFYLEERGYHIIERNYRCREGEADIVAYDEADDSIVLVEVKTRRKAATSLELYPEEAVNKKKRRRYRRIAACYVMEHYPVQTIRFDVVGVCIHDGRTAGIQHILGAFDWDADL